MQGITTTNKCNQGGSMKVTSNDFKFILQTLNRIDNDSEVEFQGEHWSDDKKREYKNLDKISIVFSKEKNEKTKLIINIS